MSTFVYVCVSFCVCVVLGGADRASSADDDGGVQKLRPGQCSAVQ